MTAGPTLGLLVMAGAALVVQNLLMARITGAFPSVFVALLMNSAVGLVLLLGLLFRQGGLGAFEQIAAAFRPWFLLPGVLGTFFVYASITGYRSMGAAPTIACLVASQLVFGLAWDMSRSGEVSLRGIATAALGAGLLIAGVLVILTRDS